MGRKNEISLLSKLVYNGIFIVLFLIILTPTSFNSLIVEFFESIGAKAIVGGIVGGYLPSLLLLIYQQVIMPEAVEFLVELERHPYKHDEISSGLRKYLFYFAFYIFVYPLFGLQFIQLIDLLINSDSNWEQDFADNINTTGQFFTIFLVHETF